MPWDPEIWNRALGGMLDNVAIWLPNLFAAFVLLILGWLTARLAQFLIGGLVRRVGLDALAERAGATEAFGRVGWDTSASHLLSRFAYWLILLVFLLAAVESLGLEGVTNTLGGLVAYLPHVLAAALILLVGSLVARAVGDAVGALAVQSGVTTGPLLGQLVLYVLLIFASILALEQLGVETTLLVAATIAIIAATALAMALAFGLGNRELARNIMAGFHAREEFEPGETLTVKGHTGRLVNIGPTTCWLDTGDGRVSLPNFVLMDEEVVVGTKVGEP